MTTARKARGGCSFRVIDGGDRPPLHRVPMVPREPRAPSWPALIACVIAGWVCVGGFLMLAWEAASRLGVWR